MTDAVESFFREYAGRYSAFDADGVAELCDDPFLAIREGVAIHLPDREAVRDHFAAMIGMYRGMSAAIWSPVEIDVHPTGDNACFATVRWNARSEEGELLRDTRTTYHLLAGTDGWRLLSYTNHF